MIPSAVELNERLSTTNYKPDKLYTKDEFIILFQNDFWKLLRESGHSIAAGIGAWLLVSIPLFIILFYSCLFLFRRWRKSDDTLASSEVESLS